MQYGGYSVLLQTLTCIFQYEGHRRKFSGIYWIEFRHFRRDLPYSDMRRFEIPSEAGPVADCTLIICHLNNSHLFAFKRPDPDSRFVIKMLAALATRNVSVDTLRLLDDDDAFSDYQSVAAVFGGGMRVATLELSLFEHEFTSLVKTIDFFRMSTVRRLKALKLQLVRTSIVHLVPA